jgi:hypothetical protein
VIKQVRLIMAAFVAVAGALIIPLGTGTTAYLAFAAGNLTSPAPRWCSA